jgi:hypothetical protein
MTSQEAALLKAKKDDFPAFYEALVPDLVDFIDAFKIQSPHLVLKNAPEYLPYLHNALADGKIIEPGDRTWLLIRLGYFIGEFFAQKYEGAWYVNEISGSRYFARYVIGQFDRAMNPNLMIEPFEVARDFVDSTVPRNLKQLVSEVEQAVVAQLYSN